VSDVSFKTKDLGKSRIKRSLKGLRDNVALVGIPGGTADNGMTLAAIALIQEKGHTQLRIPPRPFMRETREKASRGRFRRLMEKVYQSVVEKALGAVPGLKILGQAYEGELKDIFTSGNFAPNSSITVSGGWMRNRISGKPFKVEGKKSSRPLIDTGRLRQSITYKVVKV
jgi:hypothetical protein